MLCELNQESSERAEKLAQQVSELEATKDAAAANATDAVKARQLGKFRDQGDYFLALVPCPTSDTVKYFMHISDNA